MVKLQPAEQEQIEIGNTGEKVTLAEIYDRYYGKLVQIVRGELGQWVDEAEDIAMDIILEFPTKIKTYKVEQAAKSRDPLLSWLYRVAKNKVYDFFAERNCLESLEELIEEKKKQFSDPTLDLDKEDDIPVDILSLLENAVVKCLTDKERLLLKLLWSEAIPREQLAKILDVKPDTLRKIRQRIREKLPPFEELRKQLP